MLIVSNRGCDYYCQASKQHLGWYCRFGGNNFRIFPHNLVIIYSYCTPHLLVTIIACHEMNRIFPLFHCITIFRYKCKKYDPTSRKFLFCFGILSSQRSPLIRHQIGVLIRWVMNSLLISQKSLKPQQRQTMSDLLPVCVGNLFKV